MSLAPDGPAGAGAAQSAGSDGATRVDQQIEQGEGVEQRVRAEAEKSEALPPEVRAAFPGVDLSDVLVVRDSPEASKAGALAFTEGNLIHLAPGKGGPELLRHEAAHVVQQRKGKQQDPKKSPRDKASEREKEASAAETGGAVDTARLGASPAGARQKKETGGSQYNRHIATTSTHGKTEIKKISWLPTAQITFENGAPRLDQVSGVINLPKSWTKGIYWPGKGGSQWKRLIRHTQYWPIPSFPVAGVTVQLDANAQAKMEMKPSIKYTVARNSSDQWVASLMGQGEVGASVALSGSAAAGAELNAIIQKGGVGLFGRLSLAAEPKGTLKAGGKYNFNTGEGSLSFGGDFDVAGTLTATGGFRAWVEGWFANSVKEWPLVSFPIAFLTGPKAKYEGHIGTDGAYATDAAAFDLSRLKVGLGKAPDLK